MLLPISSPRRIAFDLSELLENLLKGLNGSEGAIRRVTGLLPRPLECSRGGECLGINVLTAGTISGTVREPGQANKGQIANPAVLRILLPCSHQVGQTGRESRALNLTPSMEIDKQARRGGDVG